MDSRIRRDFEESSCLIERTDRQGWNFWLLVCVDFDSFALEFCVIYVYAGL